MEIMEVSAIITIISSLIGPGFISLPNIFLENGFLNGTLILFIISLISLATYLEVSYAAFNAWKNKNRSDANVLILAEKHEKLSYATVSKMFTHRIFAFCIDLCIILQGFGYCLWYYLKIIETISLFYNVEIRLWESFAFILPIYVIALKNNKKISRYIGYALFAFICCLTSILSIISMYFLLFIDKEVLNITREYQDEVLINESNFLNKLGSIMFLFANHHHIMRAFLYLKHKSVRNFCFVSLCSVMCTFLIYLIFGWSLFYIGGYQIKNSIFELYVDEFYDIIIDVASGKLVYFMWFSLKKLWFVFFIGIWIASFLLQTEPTIESIIDIIQNFKYISPTNEYKIIGLKSIILTIFCGFICVFSILGPDIITVIFFIAENAVNALTFIFPSILFVACINEKNIKSFIGCLIGIFGLSNMCYMFFENLGEFYNE